MYFLIITISERLLIKQKHKAFPIHEFQQLSICKVYGTVWKGSNFYLQNFKIIFARNSVDPGKVFLTKLHWFLFIFLKN